MRYGFLAITLGTHACICSMRLALCLEYPLHQHGGVEVLVRELLAGLSDTHEIYLVSADAEDVLDHSPLRQTWKAHFSWPVAESTRADSLRLSEWLRDNRVELAHFHGGGTYAWRARSFRDCPIPIVAKAGIACLSTNHGAFSIFECVGPQRPPWFKLAALPPFWLAKLYQLAHVRWEATVSKHDLHAMQRRFFPMRHKFIQIYHSTLDGSRPLNPDKKPVVLCLGTVGPRKGQWFLVEAFALVAAKFPDWRLIIAGRHADPQSNERLKESIRRGGLQDRCEVLRDVSHDVAQGLLETSAVFAIPSTHEGLGLSLQEAMFAGAACIGSRAGGITDLIEHGKTGLLVSPADPASLAAALKDVMADSALRNILSNNGRASIIVKGMTRQGMIEKHRQLYQEALAD
jgi:glycosyltransferase involved in cell wall biosynthesis